MLQRCVAKLMSHCQAVQTPTETNNPLENRRNEAQNVLTERKIRLLNNIRVVQNLPRTTTTPFGNWSHKMRNVQCISSMPDSKKQEAPGRTASARFSVKTEADVFATRNGQLFDH